MGGVMAARREGPLPCCQCPSPPPPGSGTAGSCLQHLSLMHPLQIRAASVLPRCTCLAACMDAAATSAAMMQVVPRLAITSLPRAAPYKTTIAPVAPVQPLRQSWRQAA